MIKGFFFDLDGTLVDTHQANYQAYKKALEVFGISITFDDFKKTIGHHAQDFLPKLAPGLKPYQYKQISDKKAVYYKDVVHISELNTKLVQFLDMVSKDNQIVLITTARRVNAKAVLEHHRLTSYFDHIITREDVRDSKPSPEAYQLALKKTGLTNAEAVAFEDSEVGRSAAEAAGIPVVMVREFTV